MTSLTSLIERIEAATEGSRELDGDIALLVGWEPTHDRQSTLKWSDTYPSCRERWIGDRAPFNNWRVPHYSTSIDAALTLLPEGYAVTGFMIWPGEPSSATVVGTTRRPFGKDHRMSWVHGAGDGTWRGNGATAPLALLAAIFRGRQTEGR